MKVEIPIWRNWRLCVMKDHRSESAPVLLSGIELRNRKTGRRLFEILNSENFEECRFATVTFHDATAGLIEAQKLD